ncbi:MAG: hypothetical protein Q9207_005911 [Kuettlingeria erythrocarpa]
MPAYRNITINLVSQFDILNIPEYAFPATLEDPFSAPPAVADKALVSCYVPIYPLSQFWFSYSISAPHPPKALYYFKLFINGTCVVSWGCGEENEFKGKTMYGFYDAGERWKGQPEVDVRAFTFASDNSTQHPLNDTLGQAMEVRVYRSRGRKRIRPDLENFKAVIARSGNHGQMTLTKAAKGQSQNMKGGISMLNAGLLPDDQARRYYKYSLLDPLDQPFARFRWYYRTWTQLEALGVTKPLRSPPSKDADAHRAGSAGEKFPKLEPGSRSPPSSRKNTSGPDASPGSLSDISPLTLRGLSLPAIPLIDLPAPISPPGSPLQRAKSPTFTSSSSITSTQSRFAQLIRRSSRSPSPPKVDDSVRPPSPIRIRRTASMAALMGAVQNAMRRHGRSSEEPRAVVEEGLGQRDEEAQGKKDVKNEGDHN